MTNKPSLPLRHDLLKGKSRRLITNNIPINMKPKTLNGNLCLYYENYYYYYYITQKTRVNKTCPQRLLLFINFEAVICSLLQVLRISWKN